MSGQPSRQFTQPRLGAWLTGRWLIDGPPVCVIEGFSGLGKSYLARQLRDDYAHASAYVDIADTYTSFEDFLLRAQGRLKRDADISIPLGANTASAVEQALRSNLLLVVDDFQNCISPGTHELTKQFSEFLRRLGSRRAGRLLLLTSQSIDEDQCHELGIVQHTLKPLPPDDGGRLLLQLLTARDRQSEVPTIRLAELANWLGSNPRAMKALVSALAFTPLKDLVGTEPDVGEIGYRYVDELLVAKLEKRFVQRTIDRLEPTELLLLERLSVHRKSFGREAINLAHTNITGNVQQAIQELVALFFLEHHRSEYFLNPTARELALRSLLRNHKASRSAHHHAADFYLRHFKAKRAKPVTLTDNFMEARHHLHLSERTSELREVAQTFVLSLQRSAMIQPLPEDPDELDEQILLLDAALEQGSPSGLLNLRLARMLLRRGREGDLELALAQTTEAISIPPASPEVWSLHLELTHQVSGIEAVRPLRSQALAALPAALQPAVSMVYVRMLRQAERYDEALEIILDRIANDSDGNDRDALYIQAIKLLSQVGDFEGLERTIAEAFSKYDVSTNTRASVALYQICIDFYMKRSDHASAVKLLDDGLQRLAPDNLADIYHIGIRLHGIRGDYTAATNLIADGIRRVPLDQQAHLVYQAGISLHAYFGDFESALALLDESQRKLPKVKATLSLLFIGIQLHVHKNDLDSAVRLGLQGLVMPQSHTVVEALLLTVFRFTFRSDAAERARHWWDEIEKQLDPRMAALSQVLRLMASRSWTEAAEVATQSRVQAATPAVVRQEAFAFLAAGDLDGAAMAMTVIDLTKIWRGADKSHGRVHSWIVALVHAVRGENTEARRLISEHWDFDSNADLLSSCIQVWLKESDITRPVPSTFFPMLPKEITGMSEDLVHPSVCEQEDQSAPNDDNRRGPAVLALATEWSSAHGGLNTLNRLLCCALAIQKADVVCMVLNATEADHQDAKHMGVTLRVAVGPPGGSEQAALSSLAGVPSSFKPDYIIGHGRVTGPAAYQLAEHFPGVKRLHVIHMAPDEIEWHKPGRKDDAGERSEQRHQIEIDLAKNAHCTVAIGPRLYQRYLRDLSIFDTARAVCLVPGFDIANEKRRTPPPGDVWKVLVAGRAEDATIKGIDIAARAVGLAARNLTAGATRVELWVRGAPEKKSEKLRKDVLTWADLPSLDIVVRPYSSDRDSMVGDLETSTLVLMPSRQEGFGLVGLEAITAGVPVLVSSSSGLGNYLAAIPDVEEAGHAVVPMSGDFRADAERWSVAINAVLFDRGAAFDRAARLRSALAGRNTWAHVVSELLVELEVT